MNEKELDEKRKRFAETAAMIREQLDSQGVTDEDVERVLAEIQAERRRRLAEERKS